MDPQPTLATLHKEILEINDKVTKITNEKTKRRFSLFESDGFKVNIKHLCLASLGIGYGTLKFLGPVEKMREYLMSCDKHQCSDQFMAYWLVTGFSTLFVLIGWLMGLVLYRKHFATCAGWIWSCFRRQNTDDVPMAGLRTLYVGANGLSHNEDEVMPFECTKGADDELDININCLVINMKALYGEDSYKFTAKKRYGDHVVKETVL